MLNIDTTTEQSNEYLLPNEILNVLNTAQLFLFDLDGTLSNTEPYQWQALNTLLSKQEIELTTEDIARYIGNNELEIYKMIQNDYNAVIDETFFQNRIKEYLAIIQKENLLPYDYVISLLSLYENIPRALVTSQIPKVVETVLKKINLDKYFSDNIRLYCHDGLLTKKEIYQNPVKYINTPIKVNGLKHVVVFEDAPNVLLMAQQVGVQTIGIVHELNKDKMNFPMLIDTTAM